MSSNSAAARFSNVVANVPKSVPKLADQHHVIAPGYPGNGQSAMPSVDEFEYTFDSMASVVDKPVQKPGVDRYSLHLMDHANRRRIKIRDTSETVAGGGTLLQQLNDDSYGKPQRSVLFHIEAWDVNCPQHIVRRLSEDQMAPVVDRLKTRVTELELENA
ncbi:MAG: hypothetical protein GY903_07730 [Fuerstiella sp.]|nr:hypothetical protein [Fuerstiella sp.]MCP4854367.1 hypothetical protein [Fuerstiella sp.]